MPRKTITLPEYLDEVIAAIAERRGTSYSTAVVQLLDEATAGEPLPYFGIAEGLGDLSIRAEEYLDEIADELWDDHRYRPAHRSA